MIKKIFKFLIATIFPDRCLTCNCLISQDALFCQDHWQELKFITEPKCKICSHPFEYSIFNSQNLICPNCLKNPPFFDSSEVVFVYNKIISKVIFDLKYYDATFLAKKMAKILSEKFKNKIDDYDLIVAVPLHKKRLKQRKFNQVILICKNILKYHKHLKFYPDLLIRTRYNKAQAHLNQKERRKNLKGNFEINKKFLELISKKKILLIDDVTTTGETLNNCAKILKKAGAKEIKIATIAKTILNVDK